MNEERDKLFIKIFDIYKVNKTHHQCIEAIVDYILADRKRICEPIIVAIKKAEESDCAHDQCDAYEEGIFKTIKCAGLEE